MFILLPNQLFKNVHTLKGHNVYMYCHSKFIVAPKDSVIPFHYCKVLHLLASMFYYISYLRKHNIKVTLIEHDGILPKSENSEHTDHICVYNPVDTELMKLFKSVYTDKLKVYETPLFIESSDHSYYKRHSAFYRAQRIKRGILMNGKEPLYGKWSYDHDNRNAYPKDISGLLIPKLKPVSNKWTDIAKRYITTDQLLSKVYKHTNDTVLIFPVTHTDAKRALNKFVKVSLMQFGKYQDAVHTSVPFGYHSVLSALINNGLLTAKETLDTVLKVKVNVKNIASVEGFIRQLFWREYVRMKYNNSKMLIQTAKFKGSKRIDATLWGSTTNVVTVPPHIELLLERYRKYGYLTHIERLIFIGSYLLINEIHHRDIYNWYNSFVDAYEWVMIPNVYGMLLYSNQMMSRPYIVSSNYVTKMSNMKRDNWSEGYDKLYRIFVKKHKLTFY